VFSLQKLRRDLSFGNIGAVYVWILIIVIFTLWVPAVFPTMNTVRAIANNLTTSALAALAILIPMSSGTFDASVGGTMSLSSVICAYLLIHTGLPIPVVMLVTVLSGVAVGLFNALAVVVLKIPSLIATLATWLIADSLSIAVSGNRTITSTRVSGSFTRLSRANFHGFGAPFFYVIILMVVLAVLLTQTTSGRHIYAVGFDAQVSRLAGVRVKAVQAMSLVCAGAIGAFAGIVLTARLSSATPSSGSPYLLPAFAAAFLGATQFKAKRFNAVGTIIAVYMLGTGQYGLLLASAPQWMPNVFQGIALVAAIGLTQLQDPTRAAIRKRQRAAARAAATEGETHTVGDDEPTSQVTTDQVALH
jgi:ribose transport system permease protein